MNRSNHTADRPIALLGSGGHAKLVFSCLGSITKKLVQFVVSNTDVQHPYFKSIIRYASDADFLNSSMRDCSLINGIGANPNVSPRTNVFKNYKNHGFKFETVISPSAFVGEDVSIGEGALVLPNSTINVGVNIEENVVIYSGAIVEHDCQIGALSYFAWCYHPWECCYRRGNIHRSRCNYFPRSDSRVKFYNWSG